MTRVKDALLVCLLAIRTRTGTIALKSLSVSSYGLSEGYFCFPTQASVNCNGDTGLIPPPTYMARFRNPTPLLRGRLLTVGVFLGLDVVLHHHRWGIKSKVGLVSQQRGLDWRGSGWTIYSIYPVFVFVQLRVKLFRSIAAATVGRRI